eukprot:1555033-Amphidinium_carterae.1
MEERKVLGGLQYFNQIGLAPKSVATTFFRNETQQKKEKELAKLEELRLAIPQWLRATMQPLAGKGMLSHQRALLPSRSALEKAAELYPGAGEPSEESKGSDEGKEDAKWAEEGAWLESPLSPLAKDPVPEVSAEEAHAAAQPITSVDAVQDLPLPQRFSHIPHEAQTRAPKSYNSLLGKENTGIYQPAGPYTTLGKVRINLDEVAGDVDLSDEGDIKAVLQGGYTIVDLLSQDTFDNVPKEVIRYISVSAGALKGVQQHILPPREKIVSRDVLDQIWEQSGRSRRSREELPFLTHVPFDSGIARSGGTTPFGRLPREKLLDEPEPE